MGAGRPVRAAVNPDSVAQSFSLQGVLLGPFRTYVTNPHKQPQGLSLAPFTNGGLWAADESLGDVLWEWLTVTLPGYGSKDPVAQPHRSL